MARVIKDQSRAMPASGKDTVAQELADMLIGPAEPDIPARSREATEPLFNRASRRTPTPEQVCSIRPGIGWMYPRRRRHGERSPTHCGAAKAPDGTLYEITAWSGIDTAGREFMRLKIKRID